MTGEYPVPQVGWGKKDLIVLVYIKKESVGLKRAWPDLGQELKT